MTLGLLGGVLFYGAVRGGEFDAFVAEHGSTGDVIARGLGFRVNVVTIAGSRELNEAEIMAAAGLTPRQSLLFLDVAEIRDRLKAVALVREASVRKFYPDRLLIDIAEREPYALWQKDGVVMVIAADGTAIQEARDSRFVDLPFVAGVGANLRVSEFQKIMEAGGDIYSRVRAGVLVGERRWNIKMANGLDVKLPEEAPEAAFAAFAKYAAEQRLLDKELISVDLRTPGRMFARMSEESAAARAEAQQRRKPKGGQT